MNRELQRCLCICEKLLTCDRFSSTIHNLLHCANVGTSEIRGERSQAIFDDIAFEVTLPGYLEKLHAFVKQLR